MTYYEVYITGEDQQAVGLRVRHELGGRAADYTSGTNLFYVERRYDAATLKANVLAVAGEGYDVRVKRITKKQFNGG